MFYIRYWNFFFFFFEGNVIRIRLLSFIHLAISSTNFGSINVYKKLVYVNFQNFLAHLD